jgi:hypothetical protein
MARISVLTAQAQADLLRFQESSGYLNDLRLESFGFFLADYTIQGAALSFDEVNTLKAIVSEGIISFDNNLWRSFVSEFHLKKFNTTYYVGFLAGKGYIIGETEPSEEYLRIWSIPIDANGVVGTPIDHRTLLDKVKFKSAYNGIYLNTQEVIDAINNAVAATDSANNVKYIADYNVGTNYKKNNIVTFGGSSYIAKQDTIGNAPPLLPATNNAYWALSGRKGADGTGTVVRHRDEFIATAGQTVFTLSNPYDQFQHRIDAEVGGVPQKSPDNFTETSSTSATFTEGILIGTKVIFTYFSEAVPLREDLEAVINTHTNSINEHETRLVTIETTPINQAKMGLDIVASATGKAVRWDEFSLKHNNDGTFKTNVITNDEIGLLAAASATGDAIRWNEFSSKHNNDGSFKAGVITNVEINLATGAIATGDAIRWDEFSIKHNNDGTFKTGSVGNADMADLSINNAKISNTAAIVASKLAIQKLYKKSPVPVVSALADTFGTVIDLIPVTGFVSLVPQMFNVVFGGIFGAETATVDITVTFSDATTATVTKTATAIGNSTLTSSELMALIKDDVYVTKISVKSKSSIASSTATTTVTHFGFYL